MITPADVCSYDADGRVYNRHVKGSFTIGDVIRKARTERRWNQERLGKEAELYKLTEHHGPINKSTVSKVERNPFTSELGTVWRLLAALGIALEDVTRHAPPPFIVSSKEPPRRVTRSGGR